jgi:AbrB family looped-hinge helix DNA binding protein
MASYNGIMRPLVRIDNAGRLVLPKQVRERHGLAPGSELELAEVTDEIRLRPVPAEPPLKEVHGFLVYTGRFAQPGDAVRRDRADRLRRAAGR